MLQELSERQVQPASAMLARVFQDDPMSAYVFPNPQRRQQQMTRLQELAVRYGLLYGKVYVSAGVGGAAVWVAPGKTEFSLPRLLRSGMWRGGFYMSPVELVRMAKIDALTRRLKKASINGRYWYLFVLGVEPSHQGNGLGCQLLQTQLEQADSDRLPCYLETMKESNLDFYLKYGFQTAAQGTTGDRLPVWTMVRKPR